MGTRLDWHTTILRNLEEAPSSGLAKEGLQALSAAWRAGFFAEIQSRFETGMPEEDIDVTHRRVLDRLLEERGVGYARWDLGIREKLVRAWHTKIAWPDAMEALERLKGSYFLIVLANGTTRLQLDIVQSSGLPLDALLSSQLLGLTKPDPAIDRKAMDLAKAKPEDYLMVAAHAYELRAAKSLKMHTAYIQRETEDPQEDMTAVRGEVDMFIDGRGGGAGVGLAKLADMLLEAGP